MASPQKKNGYTPIPNEIVEQLARVNLSAYEWRTLLVIFRKTHGWRKPDDRISVTQFQKITGLKRRHQSRALESLINREIVTCRGDSYIRTYCFQNDFTKWKTVTYRGDSVTYRGDRVSPVEVTKLSPVEVPTKEKRNYTKETDSILAAWNSFCLSNPSLKAVQTITKERSERLRARLAEKEFDFPEILRAITEQSFLINGNPQSGEHKDWRVNFDWLIANDSNYIKVLERKYKNNDSGWSKP